jgi:hypothetical protein
MWRARFGRGFGPVVRQTTKWMNEWMNEWIYTYMCVCVCVYVCMYVCLYECNMYVRMAVCVCVRAHVPLLVNISAVTLSYGCSSVCPIFQTSANQFVSGVCSGQLTGDTLPYLPSASNRNGL